MTYTPIAMVHPTSYGYEVLVKTEPFGRFEVVACYDDKSKALAHKHLILAKKFNPFK